MPTSFPLPRLLGLAPVEPGQPVPRLSLTAEEGTWVRLADLVGRRSALLVFFRSLQDEATDRYLTAIDACASALAAKGTVVYGITQHRTDALRAYRARHGLSFHLLYDPLALQARTCGASHHLRPLCRNAVMVVGSDGVVLASRRAWIPVEELLSLLPAREDRSTPGSGPGGTFTGLRDPGTPRAPVRRLDAAAAAALLAQEGSCWVLLDVRSAQAHAAWHPSGAVHIPLDELPHRTQELCQTTGVICLSDTGDSSATAAEFLTSVGFGDVVHVLDGTSGWPGAPEEVR
jgi:rhodanese-related sulfurtransferase/peroxiredoxin